MAAVILRNGSGYIIGMVQQTGKDNIIQLAYPVWFELK